jgi:hypothetical protein
MTCEAAPKRQGACAMVRTRHTWRFRTRPGELSLNPRAQGLIGDLGDLQLLPRHGAAIGKCLGEVVALGRGARRAESLGGGPRVPLVGSQGPLPTSRRERSVAFSRMPSTPSAQQS